jgi:alginate O-acetyltransferase complex protein AlgJ
LSKIKSNLEILTRWFDAHGMKFYFYMIPIKARIYPEMMPDALRNQMAISRLDQLYDYLQKDTLIRLIDCRKELLEGKNTRVTYYKADNHWNEYGGFIGYQKLTQRVHKDFPNLIFNKPEEFKIDSIYSAGGDQESLIGFDDAIWYWKYSFKLNNAVEPLQLDSSYIKNPPEKKCIVRQMPKKVNGLKLFMIRDSFTINMMDLLSRNFDRSVYAWTTEVPVPIILNESPNIVVFEMLEQFCNRLYQLPPEIANDSTFLNTYRNTK